MKTMAPEAEEGAAEREEEEQLAGWDRSHLRSGAAETIGKRAVQAARQRELRFCFFLSVSVTALWW